jgi:hypothetical protein
MINGLKLAMLKILKKLKEKHYTNTKVMTVALVKCLHCQTEFKIIHQNAIKHNRLKRSHCQHCIQETYHNMTGTRIHRIWSGMIARAKDVSDQNYAGRGIGVCQEWEDFRVFYNDMHKTYKDHLTIERTDVNKHYCKENCTWVTMFDQQSNKRTTRRLIYQGKDIHLAELVRQSGVSKMKLTMRLNKGMTADEAVEDAKNSPYGKSKNPVNKKRREMRKLTSTI